jgi:hypothetical protein
MLGRIMGRAASQQRGRPNHTPAEDITADGYPCPSCLAHTVAHGKVSATLPHTLTIRDIQYSLVYLVLVNPVLLLNRSKADGVKPEN